MTRSEWKHRIAVGAKPFTEVEIRAWRRHNRASYRGDGYASNRIGAELKSLNRVIALLIDSVRVDLLEPHTRTAEKWLEKWGPTANSVAQFKANRHGLHRRIKAIIYWTRKGDTKKAALAADIWKPWQCSHEVNVGYPTHHRCQKDLWKDPVGEDFWRLGKPTLCSPCQDFSDQLDREKRDEICR